MPVISQEIERLERYAAYLDDRRLSATERAEIARQLNFLIGGHEARHWRSIVWPASTSGGFPPGNALSTRTF
jgi:hypothetical protein